MTTREPIDFGGDEDIQMRFTKTIHHFVQQKRRSVAFVDGKQKCLYRNPEGFSCGVGCHISDEKYYPDLDRSNYSSFIILSSHGIFVGSKRMLEFMEDIQEVHDNNISAEELRHGMHYIANKYELDPTGIELITEWS